MENTKEGGMKMQNQTQMCQKEYEDFVTMVKNFTDDQIWVALRNIPAEKLWQDLYARFNEQAEMVEQMKKIARI